MEGGFADCKADVPEGFIVFRPPIHPPLHTHTPHTLSLSPPPPPPPRLDPGTRQEPPAFTV